MISSLTGKVKGISTAANSNSVVIEVGGVGILVNTPLRVIESLKIGDVIDLHTHLIVREDALTLYGFSELVDRNLFELLLTVTGVGPKVAQSILGVNPASVVADMIKANNLKSLEATPGLGKKGAQRLVLELKDKLANFSSSSDSSEGSLKNQVESALQGLGYTPKESRLMVNQALNQISGEQIDIASAIKLALATSSTGKSVRTEK
jgi:Holliday junction DNA helicase RuvA